MDDGPNVFDFTDAYDSGEDEDINDEAPLCRLIEHSDHPNPKTHELKRGRINIGSGPKNTIVLDHDSVYHDHCRLDISNGFCFVEDLTNEQSTQISKSPDLKTDLQISLRQDKAYQLVHDQFLFVGDIILKFVDLEELGKENRSTNGDQDEEGDQDMAESSHSPLAEEHTTKKSTDGHGDVIKSEPLEKKIEEKSMSISPEKNGKTDLIKKTEPIENSKENSKSSETTNPSKTSNSKANVETSKHSEKGDDVAHGSLMKVHLGTQTLSTSENKPQQKMSPRNKASIRRDENALRNEIKILEQTAKTFDDESAKQMSKLAKTRHRVDDFKCAVDLYKVALRMEAEFAQAALEMVGDIMSALCKSFKSDGDKLLQDDPALALQAYRKAYLFVQQGDSAKTEPDSNSTQSPTVIQEKESDYNEVPMDIENDSFSSSPTSQTSLSKSASSSSPKDSHTFTNHSEEPPRKYAKVIPDGT